MTETSEKAETATPAGFPDAEVLSCPFPFYHLMHAQAPVFSIPEFGYLVSRYEDVAWVLRDDSTFSSARIGEKMAPGAGASFNPARESVAAALDRCPYPRAPLGTLAFADPPDHTRHRALVAQTFTPRRIRALEAKIRAHAQDLVASWPDHGIVDFVGDFAAPMSIGILCELLGVDPEDRLRFREWTDAYMTRMGTLLPEEEDLRCAELMIELQHFLIDIFARRKQDRRDDLFSDLVFATAEGENPLTEEELISIAKQLVVAGNYTTRGLMSSMMSELAQRPEVIAQLRADRKLIPTAIEETLRLQAPAVMFSRVTTREVEVGGVMIPEGELVLALIHAGNVDEGQFPDSLEFRLDRANPRAHMAFGYGAHYCVGAPLSRAEAEIAYNVLFDTFSAFELVPGADPTYPPNFQVRALPELKLSVTR